jgi:nucleoid-associated protein Lsr2
MAQKVMVSLVDDLDGGSADETVAFGLDGKAYEIDLSSANAGKLRDSLAEFVATARKSGGASRGRRASGTGSLRATSDPERGRAIRDWARGQGMEVSTRGRIAAEVVEAYHKNAQK